jgi:hypothetical protein
MKKVWSPSLNYGLAPVPEDVRSSRKPVLFGNLLAVALASGLLCVGSCHFAVWCEENDLRELADIEPMHVTAYHVTAYIELLQNFSAGPRG